MVLCDHNVVEHLSKRWQCCQITLFYDSLRRVILSAGAASSTDIFYS